jgi:hypothetical protein
MRLKVQQAISVARRSSLRILLVIVFETVGDAEGFCLRQVSSRNEAACLQRPNALAMNMVTNRDRFGF